MSPEAGASGPALLDLVEVMDRLRRECPWDREQSHRSLAKYLLEETYEVLEAIDTGDREHLREELGDLLLQVYFHARIASEDPAGFDIDDVARGIADKLVHRHPHVFADGTAETAEDVEANWHRLKAQEKGRASVTDGIPRALPALLLASKELQRTGEFDLPSAGMPAAAAAMADVADEAALGDLLLALSALAREQGLDAEAALRDASRRRIAQVRAAEGLEPA